MRIHPHVTHDVCAEAGVNPWRPVPLPLAYRPLRSKHPQIHANACGRRHTGPRNKCRSAFHTHVARPGLLLRTMHWCNEEQPGPTPPACQTRQSHAMTNAHDGPHRRQPIHGMPGKPEPLATTP